MEKQKTGVLGIDEPDGQKVKTRLNIETARREIFTSRNF